MEGADTPPFYYPPSNEEITFASALVAAVKGHKFNGGVFLAEAHESLEMIASTARSLASAMSNIKHGNLAGAARDVGVFKKWSKAEQKAASSLRKGQLAPDRVNDFVTRSWLSLQFGWKPMLNDVHDAAEYAASKLNKPVVDTMVKIARSWKDTYEIDYPSTRGKVSRSTSRRVRVRLAEEPSEAWKLGLTNPANVAWNLVPYSFVADWFAPIGSYLEARSALSDISATYLVTERFHVTQLNTVRDNVSPLFVQTFDGENTNSGRTFIQRRISNQWPVPLPTPHNAKPDFWHVMTSLSLIKAAFS